MSKVNWIDRIPFHPNTKARRQKPISVSSNNNKKNIYSIDNYTTTTSPSKNKLELTKTENELTILYTVSAHVFHFHPIYSAFQLCSFVAVFGGVVVARLSIYQLQFENCIEYSEQFQSLWNKCVRAK